MRWLRAALAFALTLSIATECSAPSPVLANPTRISTRANTRAASNASSFTSTAATGLLLDSMTAPVGAYSVNDRLITAYTGALVRVVRSSDSTQQDVGYDGSNVLNRSALTTFCGANNCFIVTLYDQSGAGRNLTQSTAARRPQIVTSGTIATSGGNVVFTNIGTNGSDGLTRTDALGLTGDHDLSVFVLGKTANTADQQYWAQIGNTNGYVLGHPSGTNIITTWGSNPGDNTWTSSVGTAYQYLLASYTASSNNDQVYQNGSTLSHSVYNSVAINMANTQINVGFSFGQHSISTVIVWDAVIDAGNRTTLHAWAEIRRVL